MWTGGGWCTECRVRKNECQSAPLTRLIIPPLACSSLCRQAFLGHSGTSSCLTSPSTLNFQCFRSLTHNAVAMPSTGQPERQTAAGQSVKESWLVNGERVLLSPIEPQYRVIQNVQSHGLCINDTPCYPPLTRSSLNDLTLKYIPHCMLFSVSKLFIWLEY